MKEPTRPTVLVVDDDPANRRLLRDLVQREHMRAIEASGGEEALTMIAKEPIDLVLLDLMMPETDGMTVLSRLNARGVLPSLPVVVVTALQERSMQIEALEAGAVDFLAKPIDRLEVACKVNTLVELKRLRERLVGAVESKLVEADHLLRLRFEQSPVANISWNADLCVSAWNPAAERLFAYPAVEALGKHVSFLLPRDREQDLRALWDEAPCGKVCEFTQETATRDGRRITCEWHLAPLTNSENEVMGLSSVVVDVTERIQLQSALNQAQKMEAIGQLAGGVAHDFNNLLALILSYGSFIRDSLPEGNRARDDALQVLEAGHRAAGLTRQLLSFSRHQPMAKRPTDLNQSLAQMHKLLMRTLGDHIQLSVTPAAQRTVVNIDPVQFDQIVLNLAVNARDAMPAGGQLRISLAHPPQGEQAQEPWRVQLRVSDTGAGMSAETQQRIFEPFFTTKEKGKGTGLGLATCFGIVTDVGGEISVESVEGRGTTFTVDLPLTDERADSSAGDRRIARPGYGEDILVVEDDPGVLKVTVRVLGSAGYSVHAASTGPQAIEMLDQLKSALRAVVVDFMLPGCNGDEVVAHAKRTAPHLPVILVSGDTQNLSLPTSSESCTLLRKPVSPRELVAAVAAAVVQSEDVDAVGVHALVLVAGGTDPSELLEALTQQGVACRPVVTAAEAIAFLEAEPEPSLVVCDLDRETGRRELLDWIRRSRPSLCPRVVVLTDEGGDEPVPSTRSNGIFRTLSKPLNPQLLSEMLPLPLRPLSTDPAHAPLALSPMEIPASTTAPVSSTQRGTVPPSVRGHSPARVLVVDDDDALALSCRRALMDTSFEVVTVGTLNEARLALEGSELDLLIMDIGLPDGSGLDLLPELAERHAELPVVLMTGALSLDSATKALKARVDEFLPKPFTPAQLTTVARQAIDTGRISRLRTKLLAARYGGDDFFRDISVTEKAFGSALKKIKMVFQPIVRAIDGSVFGYEALLRCDEPSLASPPRLLAAAEILGRVDDVGVAVRANVARAMLAEPERLEAIFVNLHPDEVRADLLSKVSDPLLSVANRVVLEVTERASLEAGAKLDEELARIRALGYRLAVDDLGEGYAGLSSLVHLQPDIAKIDMSLVREIHNMPLKRDIVAALVDMARRSGIIVVAEGIETVEERDTLVDLGCDLLQGYLFAKPGPPFPVPRTDFGT